MRRADVVVVGAGVMGSATAWRLSRSGRSVILLERFEVGHDRGSSHGSARVFRFSYDEPEYVAMAMEALPLWRALEDASGEELLAVTGGFDLGSDERLKRHMEALDAWGAVWDLLPGREVAARFPSVRPPPDATLLFQPDAGVLAADRAVRAMVTVARALGTELHERTTVTELRPRDGHVEVVTRRETFAGDVAVVTAGSWAPPLLATAGLDLPVTPSRETVAYFESIGAHRFPVFVEWVDGRGPLYALHYHLLKPSYEKPSPRAQETHDEDEDLDPTSGDGPDSGVTARMAAWVDERFPGARPAPHHAETCMYTNTSDERFIIDRRGRVVVGSPCSGHGFKFAPLIGERLARLATA